MTQAPRLVDVRVDASQNKDGEMGERGRAGAGNSAWAGPCVLVLRALEREARACVLVLRA